MLSHTKYNFCQSLSVEITQKVNHPYRHERLLFPIYTVLDNVNADVNWIIVHTDHSHDYEENLNNVYTMMLQREKLTYLDCKN